MTPALAAALESTGLRAIAFHLTQFPPIPENDRWWGRGFTEWTNATRARPMFAGHYQPHLPGEMGFYDLRLPEVLEAQASLAAEYGVHGFCYYYYWFGGQRLLERPLETMRESGRPDFPYCLCWANENWTRRWDGADREILIAQRAAPQDDEAILRDLLPHLRDPRYIRVDGRALLIVYRIGVLPDPARTARVWREIARREGVGELYLCAAKTYETADPSAVGFDAVVEFPPHGVVSTPIGDALAPLVPDYIGTVFDYRQFVCDWLGRDPESYPVHPTVFPGWDNTARRPLNGMVFHNATPETYGLWLEETAVRTIRRQPRDRRLLFINAWNEWAEGAHLEPDRRTGRQFLRATSAALERAASCPAGAPTPLESVLRIGSPGFSETPTTAPARR